MKLFIFYEVRQPGKTIKNVVCLVTRNKINGVNLIKNEAKLSPTEVSLLENAGRTLGRKVNFKVEEIELNKLLYQYKPTHK